MPIEPTSVSNQAIREVESTPARFGSWTSMQGSSTGGKDRPLNSIWEKAINGAQKLFGSAQSETATLEEKGDSEDHAESGRSQTYSQETSLDVTPSFGGRRFGSFGGAAFGGNTFGSVATSRAAPESGQSDFERPMSFESSQDRMNSEPVAKELPAEKDKAPIEPLAAKEKVVVEAKVEDETEPKEKGGEQNVAKTMQKVMGAQPLVAAPPVVQSSATQTEAAATQQQSTPLVQPAPPAAAKTTQAVQATQAATQTVGPAPRGQAVQSSETLSTATPSVSNKPQAPVQTPATGVADRPATAIPGEVNPDVQVAKASQSTASTNEKPQGIPSAPSKPVAIATADPQGKEARESLATKSAPSIMGTGTSKEGTAVSTPEVPVAKDAPSQKDALAFDVGKAKEAISEALGKAATKAAPASAPASATNSPQTAQVTGTPEARDSGLRNLSTEGGNTNARPAEAGTSEAKELPLVDGSKRDVAGAAQQRTSSGKVASEAGASQARANGQEGVAMDAKLNQAAGVAKASASQFARESTVAAANRIQAPATAGKPAAPAANGSSQLGSPAISGAQGMTNGVAAQNSQQGSSQNSNGDSAAKQDFNTAMQQATTSKGSEKPADGGQSFEAKVEAADVRRSEVAGKARQTSYVSKTAAEVKEVVATLTKSIDRLVTDKSGAMNLKINFEGGGSLNLRVSMENGQVTTAMQTDVVGLEGAIKANWGELANDWNQKGVRLATPQFQNSESGKDSSFENLSEFASKQERQAEGRMGEGRGRGNSQASRTRGFSSENPGSAAAEMTGSEQPKDVISDKEIKTYA